MKIAILNDTHCGIRNSSDIFIANADKFYTDTFFPYLVENNITHIIHLGDYYDNRKYINFRALNCNRKHFLKPLRDFGITMDIVRGNHDTFYKNTGELNSLKELLGHYMNEINIISDPTVMEYDGFSIGLVPWIDAENEEKIMRFLETAKCDWLGGHFEINGYEMMKGIKFEGGLERSVFKRFEKVLSGHFHTKSMQDNIEYLGSQMEFFWNDAHDNKYFHVLDTETRSLTPVRNPHTLFHRIRYDDTNNDYGDYPFTDLDGKFVKIVVINKSDLYGFDRFVDKVQSRKILELKIAENFEEFVGKNVKDGEISVEDTSELLYTYVDAVDTDLDKDRIKKEMSSLMIEAQSLEIA
tara:strand:- start:3860 stop:4921 length:1062 start_codon:yes stop_codon:yes gene_type:complete